MGTSSHLIQKKPGRVRRVVIRTLLIMAAAGVALVAGAALWLYQRAKAALPTLDGTLQVQGLQARVEVLRDARGVPHLRAQSLEDLTFAQGYVTAQDRLFQMDLNRRLAMGQLAEILGETMLRLDIESRTLGLAQACRRAAREMDPESRRLLAAYSAGVNQFIATHRDRLPVEFLLLRYTPRPWQDADSFGVALNMAKSLNTTWPDELMRERIRAKLAPDLYTQLFPDHSDLDHPVSGRSEPIAAPEAPPSPAQTRVPDAPFSQWTDRSVSQWADLPPREELGRIPSVDGPSALAALASPVRQLTDADAGSNNWVISGTHTPSGKPLLANDPHLGHSLPSVWYMIHLKAPGLDVSGVSLPGLPLVIIGHNARIAWGMTNTGPDVQDLYAESFNFRDPAKYLHNGEWVQAETREEVIPVRRASDYRFTVKVTRHGPVVSEDGGRDLALRWAALEPGALRFAFLKIDRAQNWQEFTEALRDFTGPTQNFVYADVDGNIGYYAAGWIPIRKQGDGTVPSPGSADDYDWTGYIPFEDLPHAFNPASGMIATANGRVVADGYPYLITHRWAEPFRTARIYGLLESGGRFTVSDMLRIQTDIVSLEDLWLSKKLQAAAKERAPATPDAQYALSLLENWDGVARADSAATLVCELTRQALLERILTHKLGDDLSGYQWPMSTVFLQNVLENNWTPWLPPGDPDFNMTLVKSLEAGVAKIPSAVGSRDRNAWQWGKTIPLTFRSRLTTPFPFLSRYLNVGPVAQAGTKTTVKQTTPTMGPSMRMVVDFSDFEKSVQNITLGESGQALSPHYKDQFDAWYNGQSFPMLFSDQAVDGGALHRLVLEPASRP